jgi:hypothetical protein
MKNFFRGVLFLIMIAVVVLQFIKPEITNPSEDKSKFITAKVRVPETVQRKLEVSCFDCHSYKTKLPWYSNISPIVYLIKRDVEEGREYLNFSTWTDYDREEMIDKLEEIEKKVKDEKMPLFMYKLFHPDAKLSNEEVRLITEWARDSRELLSK